jgi:starch-binding outer membrane protein, SusD/RagB family
MRANERILCNSIFLLFSCLLMSCGSDVLDVQADDEIPLEEVWKDPDLIELHLRGIYEGMGHGLHEIMLSSLTDESQFIHGYGTQVIVQSLFTPSYLGAWSDWRLAHYQWNPLYRSISQVNRLIENMDDSVFSNQDRYNHMLGEAYFLRAYYYHNLMRVYGGVPVVNEVFEIDDEQDLMVERSSFSDTIEFIIKDAKRAAELLPETALDPGRASAGAAMALTSRVLLMAASDLYNENPADTLTGYETGSREERWIAARDAALEVMNLNSYQLFSRYEDPVENYTRLFLENSDHEEAILSRFFHPFQDDDYNPGLHNGPNGYENWGGNTPIQNLIDDYEMSDGNRFDWDNPDHRDSPFENRDPRFYASILYDGSKWRQRTERGARLEPNGIIQTFERVYLPDGSTRIGIDTRNGTIQPWNGGYSRYYLRKFIDPDIQHSAMDKQEVPWMFFRYAEILLNYAEASIELGEYEDARYALNQLRERAGMPDITESGEDLKQRYRNERRIELVFEDHRFFDIRRWKIAPDVMANARGILIYADAENHHDRSTFSNFEYEIKDIQNRSWNDRSYFMPIPHNEMQRNVNLVQNPGY